MKQHLPRELYGPGTIQNAVKTFMKSGMLYNDLYYSNLFRIVVIVLLLLMMIILPNACLSITIFL